MERQQQRRAVADWRRGGQIAAKRRTIANGRRGKKRQPLGNNRWRITPQQPDVGQGCGGANSHAIAAVHHPAHLGDGFNTDEMRPALPAQVGIDAEVRCTRDDGRIRMARQHGDAFIHRGWP
jgi:hypothetical protein